MSPYLFPTLLSSLPVENHTELSHAEPSTFAWDVGRRGSSARHLVVAAGSLPRPGNPQPHGPMAHGPMSPQPLTRAPLCRGVLGTHSTHLHQPPVRRNLLIPPQPVVWVGLHQWNRGADLAPHLQVVSADPLMLKAQ